MTTSTTVNDNNTSANLTVGPILTTNATVNLTNSSGNDTVTTDGSGTTTVNANNSSGNDDIDIDNASAATVNLNNSTGNDDVDITGAIGTTVNATVNDNNSGVTGGTDDIDITGTTVNATVNLNNSLGNDDVNISGTTVNATVNLNNSGGTDIVNISGATTTATVNLNNSTGQGDLVVLEGAGTGTINANNSTGNDTLIGENSTDTIHGGIGNDTVDLKGAGTIMAGSGNDLGIYTLSDHYSLSGSTLTSINGNVDYYYGEAGINTLEIVLTPAQWSLPAVQTDLANYAAFLATNPGVNQTYTFHFGAASGTLTVAGWQDLNVQIAGSTLAATGVEGSPTALNLATAVSGFPGGSLSSLVISAIPVGAKLTDGTLADTFTSTAGHTSVDVHTWNLSSLTITAPNDANFTLAITATKAEGSGSVTTAATEVVTVDPLAPTVAPVAETGTEGSAIALNLGVTVKGLAGDSNSLSALTLSGATAGAILTDGTNSHTFSGPSDTFDIHAWNLSTLTIKPANDTNFTLTVKATETDAEGNLSTTVTATEAVIVNPLAPTVSPVAESGVENTAVGLNLGVAVNGLTGDTNSLASLVVSAIPVGAKLTDGTANTFTATSGNTSVDVHTWNLSNLRITSTSDTSFTLGIAATEKDSEGNLSTTTTNTELVTVIDPGPTATNDTGSTNEDGVLTKTAATGVLSNDHPDDSGDTISVTAVNGVAANVGNQITLTSGAAVTLAADGSYTYDPETISGLENKPVGTYTDSFSYTASDGHGDTSTATVTITVNVAAETVTAIAQTNSAADDGGVVSGNVLVGVGHDADDPLHVVNTGPTTSTLGAAVTLAADGSYTYDPETISGLENKPVGTYTDSFSYTASDGHGDTSTATVTITVNVAAETVTAIAQTNSAADDGGVVSGNVLVGVGHDADDPLHVVNTGPTTSTLGAAVTLAADGSYTYDPETISGLENKPVGTYTDSFSYTASDGHGDTSTATVTITVNVAAETVTAIAQTNSAADDGGVVSGNVLVGVGHDADDPLHVVNTGPTTSTLGAAVTLAADGSYTYDPETISGLENKPVGTYTDSFSYTASDGHGDTSTATVTITVNVAAETVTAIAQTNSAADDGGVVSGNVLVGVGHDADDPLHVVNTGPTTSTLGAAVTLAADGSYTYDPETISGLENKPVGTYTDSFSYTASDGHGDTSTATVTITVNVAAETVTAIAQTNSAADDGGVVSGNVLVGVGHDADDPLHVVNTGPTTSTLGAAVTLAADGSYTYDPETISGLENKPVGTYTDSFSYTASDGHGDTSTATVTITVNVAAETVTAIAQTNSAADDGGVVSGNVLVGVGHDADDPLHVVNTGPTTSTLGAAVTLAADGSYTYDPETISGLENKPVGTYTDSFSYTASDGHGDTSTATVTITVNVAAETVTAIAQTNSAADDGGVVSGNVLVGVGHDADDPLHVVNTGPTTSTLGAAVTLAADGSYTYDPETISGLENKPVGTYTDSFSYTASDGHGDTSTATVTITVNVAAETVTAIAQTNSAADDGGVVSGNVLVGVGHDADDPLHVVNTGPTTSTLGAAVTLAADGSYTYDPETISGLENKPVGTYTDSFSYTASDGHGDTSTATVTITVNVAAETVTAIAQTNSAADDGGVVSGNVLVGVGHDADDPLHVVNTGPTTSTLGAAVTLAADGSYTYDPETISGLENKPVGTYTDSFSYTASDGHGDTSTATVTITVNVAAETVTAIAQTNSAADDGGVVSGNVLVGVGHDADDPLHVVNTGPTTSTLGAAVTLAADGSYTYDPETISGLENKPVGTYTDSFSYTASDGHGDTSTATVTITVNVAAETVTAIAQTNSAADDGGVVSGNVLVGVGHDADDPLHVVNTGPTTSTLGAAVTLAADGSYTYDPETISGLENKPVGTYTDSFSYTASDGHGDTSTATVTITVNVAAETVTAIAQTNSAADDGGVVSGNVLVGVGHDADDPLHVVNTGPTTSTLGAAVTLAADGSYTYDPETISGLENKPVGTYTDSFSYTASDGHGDTSTATVTITVNVAAETVTAIAQTNSAADDGGVVSGNVLVGVGHDADDPLHVVNTGPTTSTLGAAVTLAADGSYTYDPETISGLENKPVGTYTDSFSYTASDGHGDTSTATVTITVNVAAETVTAPTLSWAATATGVEGTAITLGNLVETITSLSDDSNSPNTLTISGAPTGAVLSDGTHTHTSTGTGDLIDVSAWTLSSLEITPTNDANFTLTATATEKDGHGNISTTATATEVVTVNPGAPTITSVTDDVAPVTGTLANNARTNDPDLTVKVSLTGTGALAGDTVQLYNGAGTGSQLGTSYTLLAADITNGFANVQTGTLTNGTTYAITARITDAAGNQSAVSTNTFTETEDTTAPSAATITSVTDDVAPVTGTLANNARTNDPDLTVKVSLTGTGALAGDTVQLYNGAGTGSQLGTSYTLLAADITNGFANVQTGTLTNGTTYAITARITDAAGNQSAVSTNTFTETEDDTAPTTNVLTANHSTGVITGNVIDNTAGTVTVSIFFAGVFQSSILVPVAANTLTSWTHTYSGAAKPGNGVSVTASATDAAGNLGSLSSPVTAPAGVAGEAIDLGLTNLSIDHSAAINVTIAGVPAGWSLNAGTNNGDGSWTLETNDPTTLTVTTPVSFAGAALLSVTESWTNADGSTGTASLQDNVEAYAPGSPIFAVSGDDTLTGGGGNDEFVFAQPIGNDTIYNFNVASDQIDLIDFSNIATFIDIQANTADDANGNAVVTVGTGESITIVGVDAAALTASDFILNQEPVTNNTGTMTVGDGAILPLDGTIDNTGTIALGSTGDETDLEILVKGATLQGGGQVTLSDNGQNVIFGGDPSAVLTNVDNTISGAGQLGDGQMTLVNDGTIDATGTNALVLDTGTNVITNSGILDATGTGGLIVNSAVANSGSLSANGGNLTINGAVTGNGTATISGAATLEFGAASAETISFAAGSTGTLKLDDTAAFTGSVSGLTTTTYIDLADLAFVQGQTTATFTANSANPTSGGTLTVSDGTQSDTINLVGDYTQSGWTLSQDSNGDTLVVDPPLSSASGMSTSASGTTAEGPPAPNSSGSVDTPIAVLSRIDPPADVLRGASNAAGAGAVYPPMAGDAMDLTEIASGSNRTLGYSADAEGPWGAVGVGDGTHSSGIAVFGQYAAAGFQIGSDEGAGALVTHTLPDASVSDPALITNPNHKP